MENSQPVPQKNDEYIKPTMQELMDYIHTDWIEPSPYADIDVSWFVSDGEKRFDIINYKLNGEDAMHKLIKEVLTEKPQIVKMFTDYVICVDGFPALEKKLSHFTEQEQEDFILKLYHILSMYIYKKMCNWGVEAYDKTLNGSPSTTQFTIEFTNFIVQAVDKNLMISGEGI